MEVALWIVQVLLALFFLAAGYSHTLGYASALKSTVWVRDVPKGLVTFIGAVELAGGAGVILPAATGVLPWLTPLAAVGLCVQQVAAAVFHLRRGEVRLAPINLLVALLAAFVAYGRYGAGL